MSAGLPPPESCTGHRIAPLSAVPARRCCARRCACSARPLKVPAWHVPSARHMYSGRHFHSGLHATCTAACHLNSGCTTCHLYSGRHFHSGPLPRHFHSGCHFHSGPPHPPTHEPSSPSARRRYLPQDRVPSKKKPCQNHVMQNHAKPGYAKPCKIMSCKNHAKSCHAKTMQNVFATPLISCRRVRRMLLARSAMKNNEFFNMSMPATVTAQAPGACSALCPFGTS